MKVMPDIQHHHGNPFVGAVITTTLYILAKITASEAALYLTCISASVVILANLPKAFETIKKYYDRVFKKNQ